MTPVMTRNAVADRVLAGGTEADVGAQAHAHRDVTRGDGEFDVAEARDRHVVGAGTQAGQGEVTVRVGAAGPCACSLMSMPPPVAVTVATTPSPPAVTLPAMVDVRM